MVFQSAPQAAEIRCLFSLNGGEKTAGFSLYSRKQSTNWTEVDLNAIAQEVGGVIVSDLVPVLSQDHSYVGCIAKDLEAEFPLSVENIEAAPVVGGLASPALPNAAAVVVTWIGASGSAPRRGRIYLPSPAESQVTGSRLTGAAQTAILAAATALRAAVENPAAIAEASQAIISRYNGSTVVGTTVSGKSIKEATKRVTAVVNGVSQLRVSDRVDSQRRRMPREAL